MSWQFFHLQTGLLRTFRKFISSISGKLKNNTNKLCYRIHNLRKISIKVDSDPGTREGDQWGGGRLIMRQVPTEIPSRR